MDIRKANQVAIIHCIIVFYSCVIQHPSVRKIMSYMKLVHSAKKLRTAALYDLHKQMRPSMRRLGFESVSLA